MAEAERGQLWFTSLPVALEATINIFDHIMIVVITEFTILFFIIFGSKVKKL